MRIVAGRAFSRYDGLMLHGGLVGDASTVVAFETQLGHVECQELLMVVRTVRVVTEPAQGGRGGEVDVLLGRNILVMAFVAEVGHRSGEQMAVVGRMRIMAAGAFPRSYRFVLVAP